MVALFKGGFYKFCVLDLLTVLISYFTFFFCIPLNPFVFSFLLLAVMFFNIPFSRGLLMVNS